MLEEFLGRTKVAPILAKDYVDLSIDVDRMTHGKEIQDSMQKGRRGGLPWTIVLDEKGAELVTSNDANGNNIGAPVQPEEIAHFVEMIRKTKRHMTDEEVRVVADDLREFARPRQRPPRR
ncbi:MAG: hypothetical protein Fur0037_00910 [Planctomycetota bacterium]